MRSIIILSGILFLTLPAGDSFYNLSVTAITGTAVSVAGFQGKRVLVVPFNGAQVDWGMLEKLDSLQKQHSDSLAVLAVPALDFDTSVNSASLAHIHDSLGLGLILIQPGYVKKAAGASQLPVFQWLTNNSRNTHFNRDVEADGQVFVISPKGTLYSIIEKPVCSRWLPYVLSLTAPGE
jgi:glutathione peroxidase